MGRSFRFLTLRGSSGDILLIALGLRAGFRMEKHAARAVLGLLQELRRSEWTPGPFVATQRPKDVLRFFASQAPPPISDLLEQRRRPQQRVVLPRHARRHARPRVPCYATARYVSSTDTSMNAGFVNPEGRRGRGRRQRPCFRNGAEAGHPVGEECPSPGVRPPSPARGGGEYAGGSPDRHGSGQRPPREDPPRHGVAPSQRAEHAHCPVYTPGRRKERQGQERVFSMSRRTAARITRPRTTFWV